MQIIRDQIYNRFETEFHYSNIYSLYKDTNIKIDSLFFNINNTLTPLIAFQGIGEELYRNIINDVYKQYFKSEGIRWYGDNQ